jgi:hypothetical protein
MTECQWFRDQIPAALYHELNGDLRDRFASHRQTCHDCASLFAGMAGTLELMNKRSADEPEEAFWLSYGDRVMERVGTVAPEKKFHRFKLPANRLGSVPSWAYGVAAILLIAVGIYLGRSVFSPTISPVPQPGTASIQPAAGQPDSLTTIVLAYLDRSRNVLLGVINSEEGTYSPALLAAQQRVSRQLLDRGTVIKAALNRPDQQQVRQLIESLEVILLQLANIEIRPGVPMVELVKAGISKNSILLKINMEEMKAKKEPPHQTKKTEKYHS